MYLNTLTFICPDASKVDAHIGGAQAFDIIVSLAIMNGKEMGPLLLSSLEKNEEEVPVILIGKSELDEATPNVHQLPADFNLRKLLKTMGSVLNVTAEEMAQLKLPEYYPLPLRLFSHIEKSPCDIFLKIADGDPPEYAQIAAEGSSLSAKMYVEQGIKNLFIPSEMRLLFLKQGCCF